MHDDPEAQLAQALAALQTLVERLEPAMGRRFRNIDDFIAERRERDGAPVATESRSAKTVADRLDQAVARAESALEIRATTEPPPAWVRAAAASATAALDGRLQSIEETLRDQSALSQTELRAVCEATQQAVAEGVTQIGVAKHALAGIVETHRADLKRTQPLLAALHAHLDHTQQRTLVEDRRAGALSETLIALADLQWAQVEVFEAGMVALETQVVERLSMGRRPARRPRRSRPAGRGGRTSRR